MHQPTIGNSHGTCLLMDGGEDILQGVIKVLGKLPRSAKLRLEEPLISEENTSCMDSPPTSGEIITGDFFRFGRVPRQATDNPTLSSSAGSSLLSSSFQSFSDSSSYPSWETPWHNSRLHTELPPPVPPPMDISPTNPSPSDVLTNQNHPVEVSKEPTSRRSSPRPRLTLNCGRSAQTCNPNRGPSSHLPTLECAGSDGDDDNVEDDELYSRDGGPRPAVFPAWPDEAKPDKNEEGGVEDWCTTEGYCCCGKSGCWLQAWANRVLSDSEKASTYSTHHAKHNSMDMDQFQVPMCQGTSRMDILMSPPLDSATSSMDGTGRATNSADTTGFFILRKDSERRQQLINVLTEDSDKLCKYWGDAVANDKSITVLEFSKPNMMILLGGVRSCIRGDDQEKFALPKALESLVANGVDLADELVKNELLAIMYLFHDAAFRILKDRERTIQPHFIFAYDNFLRGATQAAVDCITFNDRLQVLQVDEGTTPEAPLSSASRSPQEEKRFQLYTDYQSLQERKAWLMQELVATEKNYQKVLETVIEDRRQDTVMIKKLFESQIEVDRNASTQITPIESQLNRWLQQIDCSDMDTVSKFGYQGYSLSDVLQLVDRTDLRRMNLRGGIECRIWRAVISHRSGMNGNHIQGSSYHSPPPLPSSSDQRKVGTTPDCV